MGFVGCNLNPDPSGGAWDGPPLSDRYWYPLYEALCALDVPAMIHVSAACNANLHTTTSHYLGADTTAFTQLMTSELFVDFPTLRFIIPHGGGAVPYHWGRFRGIAQDLEVATAGRGGPRQRVVRHVRLPPGRHRPAAAGRADRQHPVRVGDDGCGAWCRSRDRPSLRRHPPLHRGRRAHRRATSADLRDQRPPGLPAAGR